MKTTTIGIGLCTFRRPQVVETLESIAGQALPDGMQLRVIVADNDDVPSAEALVRDFATRSGMDVTYLHCPARNISIARNGILEETARLGLTRLAFLDDDERAPADWIRTLLGAMDESAAEIVLGPVAARYAEDAPAWMRQRRVHDTLAEIGSDGQARSGYTCNVLLDMTAPSIADLRFETARGRSGGEDTAYFHHATRNGARMIFAPDALVSEDVPGARAKLDWLLKRRFRMGQTHASLIMEGHSLAGRLALAAVAAAKVIVFLGLALIRSLSTGGRNSALMRGALHMGTVSGLLGLRPLVLYGKIDGRQNDANPKADPVGSKT